MINGAFLVSPDSFDFPFEAGDALVELRHRQRVEILPGKQHDGIVGTAGEILVGIHSLKR